MKTIHTPFLIAALILLNACSPTQRVRSSTIPKIKHELETEAKESDPGQEIQKITSEEIYTKLVLNLDAYETAWSISFCLLKKGATEDFMKHIFEKIHSKVKIYKQKVEPSQITTKSYAKYLQVTINHEIDKTLP